jgi:hypothetical protein
MMGNCQVRFLGGKDTVTYSFLPGGVQEQVLIRNLGLSATQGFVLGQGTFLARHLLNECNGQLLDDSSTKDAIAAFTRS